MKLNLLNAQSKKSPWGLWMSIKVVVLYAL